MWANKMNDWTPGKLLTTMWGFIGGIIAYIDGMPYQLQILDAAWWSRWIDLLWSFFVAVVVALGAVFGKMAGDYLKLKFKALIAQIKTKKQKR